MMKVTRKLKLELNIDECRGKAVLKQKINEVAAKERLICSWRGGKRMSKQMQYISLASGEAEIKESRKQELS